MKRFSLFTLAVILAVSTFFFAKSIPLATAKESKILQFNTMVGVSRPYTGATNKIRDIPGGGVPWVIDSGYGELKPDGTLKLSVRGLVIDPNEPNANAGKNPIMTFRVIVSCLSKDATTGAAITVNRATEPFPATLGFAADGGGNADFDATLDLPEPCIAPIVFVTSPGGSWFAATGQ